MLNLFNKNLSTNPQTKIADTNIFICSHILSLTGKNILVTTLGHHSYIKWNKKLNAKTPITLIILMFFKFMNPPHTNIIFKQGFKIIEIFDIINLWKNMYVLMSIKPKYVEKILSGEKKYEYRKTLLKKDVESILVYSTFPVKKVVCEIKLLEVVKGTLEYVYSKTNKESGITLEEFNSYFKNKNVAYAYKLGSIKKLDLTLKEIGVQTAPQSCQYIERIELWK